MSATGREPVFDYLRGRANLRRVYVLVDARHGLKANDLEALDLLDKAAVSYQVVLTKADKLKPAGPRRQSPMADDRGDRQASGGASRGDRDLGDVRSRGWPSSRRRSPAFAAANRGVPSLPVRVNRGPTNDSTGSRDSGLLPRAGWCSLSLGWQTRYRTRPPRPLVRPSMDDHDRSGNRRARSPGRG